MHREIRFTPHAADMVAAQRCFYTMRLWSLSTLISLIISLLVVAFLVWIAMPEASWRWIAFVFGSALIGGAFVPLAALRFYVPFVAERIYRQQRSLHREVAVDWDEAEFRATTEAGSSRIAWTDFSAGGRTATSSSSSTPRTCSSSSPNGCSPRRRSRICGRSPRGQA